MRYALVVVGSQTDLFFPALAHQSLLEIPACLSPVTTETSCAKPMTHTTVGEDTEGFALAREVGRQIVIKLIE